MKNHERNLLRRSEKFFKIDQHRHDHGKRQVAPISLCIRFEADAAEHADENGNPVESALLTDNGVGAELIRLCGEKPEWMEKFTEVCAALDPQDLAIILALVDDWRDRQAAVLCNRSKSAVSRFKKRLPGLFAEVFRSLDPEGYRKWWDKTHRIAD